MMLQTEPPIRSRSRHVAPFAVLSFFACFLLALAGHGLQPAPREIGKLTISSRDAGTATLPRQGVPVRIASASDRDHAKTPMAAGGLMLPLAAVADIAVAAAGNLIGKVSHRPTVELANYPRGPPHGASQV
jgi:hypothetical protein